MVFILIKYIVFEKSYDVLKLTTKNGHYLCINLINIPEIIPIKIHLFQETSKFITSEISNQYNKHLIFLIKVFWTTVDL